MDYDINLSKVILPMLPSTASMLLGLKRFHNIGKKESVSERQGEREWEKKERESERYVLRITFKKLGSILVTLL